MVFQSCPGGTTQELVNLVSLTVMTELETTRQTSGETKVFPGHVLSDILGVDVGAEFELRCDSDVQLVCGLRKDSCPLVCCGATSDVVQRARDDWTALKQELPPVHSTRSFAQWFNAVLSLSTNAYVYVRPKWKDSQLNSIVIFLCANFVVSPAHICCWSFVALLSQG